MVQPRKMVFSLGKFLEMNRISSFHHGFQLPAVVATEISPGTGKPQKFKKWCKGILPGCPRKLVKG